MVRSALAVVAVVLFIACVGPAIAQGQEPDAGAAAATEPEPATSETSDPASAPADPPEPAGGQPLGPPPGVEVIRIKGRGVQAIQTDVPDSVTQFDAAAIEALGAQNISDLAKVTPNVEIRTAGATSATFFIRGVGLSDFSSNAAGAVAIYQDEVPLNAPALQLGQLFDIEDVQVLRGPQGSGSSRNASAGAIKSSSRKPTGEYSARMRSSFGQYRTNLANDAMIQDYEGAVEVPLVEEVLASRFSFRFRDADPYLENGCANLPATGRPVTRRRPPPRVTVGDASLCGERAGIGTTGGVSQVPAGLNKWLNNQHNWAARGILRFQPPETDMDWTLTVQGSKLDQDSTLGQAIRTGEKGDQFGDTGSTGTRYVEPDQIEEFEGLGGLVDPAGASRRLAKNLAKDRPLDIRPYRGDYNREGATKLDTWFGALNGDMSFAGVDLTTITGYAGYDRDTDTDSDFTPEVLFETFSHDEAWQFTQEIRISDELDDVPFRWETGGLYLMDYLKGEPLTDTAVAGIVSRKFRQNTYSFVTYGDFSWDFLDEFTLEGGVRYNWERKKFRFKQTGLGPDFAVNKQKTWQEPTGGLSLTWRPREDVSLYWKYNHGFKAGHFNSNRSDTIQADPETIDAFETGVRGQWFDGRLGLGAALFYYQYQDYQVFVFQDEPGTLPTLEIINANDAEVYGAEVDFRAEPLAGWAPDFLDGLVLTARFGWLESEFLDFTDTVTRVGTGGVSIPVEVDFSGNQLINSPRFKVSGSVDWTFDLGRWGSIIPRYDFVWSDDIFFDPSEGRGSPDASGNSKLPKFAVGQPAYWQHNVRLAYRTPAGNIEVAAWGRNLNDTVYKSYAFDASSFSKVVINYVGQPRTIGIDITIDW